jgi:hypothetical protein
MACDRPTSAATKYETRFLATRRQSLVLGEHVRGRAIMPLVRARLGLADPVPQGFRVHIQLQRSLSLPIHDLGAPKTIVTESTALRSGGDTFPIRASAVSTNANRAARAPRRRPCRVPELGRGA